MRIKKNYEVCLDIKPIEMNGKMEQVIIDKLRETYEGRCHENSYIVKILHIVKRSMIRFTPSLQGDGTVSVVFAADAIKYNVGDIVVGCEIQNVGEDHRIICRKDKHLAFTIAGSQVLKSLKIGQKIPILVGKVQYETLNDQVSISGTPYTYYGKFIVYILSEDYGVSAGEDVEIIKNKKIEVKAAMDELSNGDKTLITKMQHHFHPYNTEPSKLLAEVKDPLSIVSILDDWHKLAKKGTVWTRHSAIEKGTPNCMFAESADVIGKEVFLKAPYSFVQITETPVNTYLALLEDYLKFIVFLREMISEYGSDKVYEEYNNLWHIYRFIKRNDHLVEEKK